MSFIRCKIEKAWNNDAGVEIAIGEILLINSQLEIIEHLVCRFLLSFALFGQFSFIRKFTNQFDCLSLKHEKWSSNLSAVRALEVAPTADLFRKYRFVPWNHIQTHTQIDSNYTNEMNRLHD